MFIPTPTAPEFKELTAGLACMALMSAEYETAWRASIGRMDENAIKQMASAHVAQRAARDVLTQHMPAEIVHAIEAALVIAAAAPQGIRPDHCRDADSSFASERNAEEFIRETVAQGGIA